MNRWVGVNRTAIFRMTLLVIPWGTMVPQVRAQCLEGCTAIHTILGEAAGDQFGWKSNNIGDVTGDGVNDFVITAPFNNAGGSFAGRAYVYSGATGAELFRMTGTIAGGQFGRDANRAGDINGDNVPDVIVGAPGAGAGRATVHSGVNGALLRTFLGATPGDQFGYRVSGGLDVNGDGTSDVLISAATHDTAGSNAGRAYAYSGADFSLICAVDGAAAGDEFGTGLNGVGDVTGDGRDDFVVGARNAGGGPGRAYVFAFDGASCTLVHTLAPATPAFDFGHLFAGGGHDVNGDSVPDVYVGDFSVNRAHVFSGADGSVLYRLSGNNNGQFGLGEIVPDVNGDGRADLILAAWVSNAGGSGAGKAFVYSGLDGSVLETFTHTTPGANFGFDAKGLGDVNGDTKADYLITAASDLSARGISYVIAGNFGPPALVPAKPMVLDAECFNGATPTATPCGTNADCPVGQACRLKSRFLSINPADVAVAAAPTALQVRVISVPGAPGAVNAAPYNYPAMVNDVWWVGAATNRVNDQSPYITAPLVCTGAPLVQDWNAVGNIHIYGDAIVPGATYEIRSCTTVSGPCSAPLVLATARHGDTRDAYNLTNFADISALVGEFQAPNAPSSLLKSHAWITPSNMTSAMGSPFGFNQISAGVTAFSGGAPPAPTLGANQCP